MTTTRKLNMVFSRGSATKTISLADPREDIASAAVKSLMQDIIDKDAFYSEDDGRLDGIKRAYIRETVITELP